MFSGTPEIAAVHLRKLIEAGLSPVCVLTQPDRPAGRGRKLHAPEVKQVAQAYNIPVWQPERVRQREFIDQVVAAKFDVNVVVSYGQILAPRMIEAPKRGSFNIHTSLLPRWRGAAPIESALLAGDTMTGVTLQKITRELDAGPIVAQRHVPIDPADNRTTLFKKLGEAGAELLVTHLPAILSGEIELTPQDEEQATYCHKFTAADGVLDFNQPAPILLRRIRALNPEPGTWVEATLANGHTKRVKLLEARAIADPPEFSPTRPPVGSVFGRPPFVIVCGSGSLHITMCQPEGKGPMPAQAYWNGHHTLRVESAIAE